jgi:para-nitrobenzyl esterase
VFDGRLGAAHGLETPFVFDDMTSGIGQFLLGGVGPVELAKVMHGAWIAFVRDGNPVTAEFPEWPEFDLDRRYVAVFDFKSRVESDPGAERRRAWEGADINHDLPPEKT